MSSPSSFDFLQNWTTYMNMAQGNKHQQTFIIMVLELYTAKNVAISMTWCMVLY